MTSIHPRSRAPRPVDRARGRRTPVPAPLCVVACLASLLLAAAAPLHAAADSARVAVLVHRPSNRLAWSHVDQQAALMLGSDRILREALRGSPINMRGAYHVNGAFRGVESGLYFPTGDSAYARWSPFVDADLFVEYTLDADAMAWTVGTRDGRSFRSREIARPHRNPHAVAGELVRVIFEASGTEPTDAARKHIERGETQPPTLFLEWAKWIGYRPHWAHHAPWQAPQASARKILGNDPAFTRGAVWALNILMKVPENEKRPPLSVQYLAQAVRALDSEFQGDVLRPLRMLLRDRAVLAEVTGLLTHDELELDLDTDGGGDAATGGGGGGDIDLDALGREFASEKPDSANLDKVAAELDGPRFRVGIVRAIAPFDEKFVNEALRSTLSNDESPAVRAAAVRAMEERAKPFADAQRRAWQSDDSGEVRQAALRSLVAAGLADAAQFRRAAQDAAAEVRMALADVLADANVEAALRRELWLALTEDEASEVRAAAWSALHQHTDMKPTDEAVAKSLRRALERGSDSERLAVVRWIAAHASENFAQSLTPLLASDAAAIRAASARALRRSSADHAPMIVERLGEDSAASVQVEVAEALLLAKSDEARDALFALLERCRPAVRDRVASAAYRYVGANRKELARVMPYDPSLEVNIAGLRMAERLGDPALLAELLPTIARGHRNEYVRARALRTMADRKMAGLHELCVAGIRSPYWVLRLEAADILADTATASEADAVHRALQSTEDPWLRMALEDALAKAEGRPKPERIRLGLGERKHTEGGDDPAGFQIWLGRMPGDLDKAREMVDAGYRFGAKTKPPNMPGGTALNAYNRSADARNIYLLDSVLEPLEKWRERLPYMYYIALFDEPSSLGSGFSTERVRAMVLEAERPDLLPALGNKGGNALAAALPENLRQAYPYYNARFGGVASNWVTHMFRLTAQRKYPDLHIFPQSLTYMRGKTDDAYDMIDADGDYAWKYHHGNFFRDGTMGAVNRVIKPGKPMNMITWMGWWKPNIINGNKLFADSNYPDGPWRFRNYMGTKSALALWATGVEAGFFDIIGFGQVSDRKGQGHATGALTLEPWSEAADEAVQFMIDDPGYWQIVEGKLELEQLEKKQENDDPLSRIDRDDGGRTFTLEEEDEATPIEKALQRKREQLYEELMTGVSYMNIFGTDTTRALSNLPKPDTSKRDTLIIMGREYPYYMDAPHMPMPAIAVVQGFDMAPNYDSVDEADLMHYDTILLRHSSDGVTPGLVEGINRWLRTKEGGLLVVWGDVTSEKTLFPEITFDRVEQPFAWESGVQLQRAPTTKETYQDRRGREKTRTVRPALADFTNAGGERLTDGETAVFSTVRGDVEPLLRTSDGKAILARWNAPEDIQSVVLFDGATAAGPVYTEALEDVILAIDEARGSDVKRNRWWGHTIYETDAFVVDVATSQLETLHDARPRQHEGVDVITGVINPTVHHGECALILKDYVGPYAGGKGAWAVMAREQLLQMEPRSDSRLDVEAKGVTRVTRIGDDPIRLAREAGFEQVENQVMVWKKMREGQPAYSINSLEGGWELHVYSPEPFTVVTGGF